MEEKKHTLILTEQREMNLTGILSVESFREDAAELESTLGPLMLTGQGLHMEKLDLDKGEVILTGKVISLYYPEDAPSTKKGLFSRLFS